MSSSRNKIKKDTKENFRTYIIRVYPIKIKDRKKERRRINAE